VVEALSPVILVEVPKTVDINVPFLYTSYPVTPTLSEEAVQVRVKLVSVILPAVRPVGTVGA
jgi:hypothetical protein